MTNYHFWRGGDRVEVVEPVVSGSMSYFPANVVNLPSVRKDVVWVEYETLMVRDSVPMKEYVKPTRLRPSPPREFSRRFKVGDEVDVFRDSEGCWVRGNVTTILGDSRYGVEFNRREIEVDRFNLRLHREWLDGSWIPSFPQESMTKTKSIKVKIKFRDEYEKVERREEEEECYEPPSKKKLKRCDDDREEKEIKFNNGMIVEVRSDEQGYEGSWFSAKIINYLRENKYTVEYQTLKTDDEKEWLIEEAKGSDIRPNPPPPLIQRPYKLYEHVDAWFNEGWWSGQVCEIKNNLLYTRYGVYFKTSNENLEFACNDLRPCQVWRQGKWTRM